MRHCVGWNRIFITNMTVYDTANLFFEDEHELSQSLSLKRLDDGKIVWEENTQVDTSLHFKEAYSK